MKQKAIEKVPFLRLPKVSKKKMAEYVAVTAVKEVRQEEHLFIEVYKNRKESRGIPVVRIVMTEKDFGTYFTEKDTWSRGRITKTTWSNYGLIWWEDDKLISKSGNIMEKENILYSPEDLKRIQEFTKEKVWNDNEWWEYIDRRQSEIMQNEQNKKTMRRWERRQRALEERKENTEELPEQKILDYADSFLFHKKHYLYYKKRGAWAKVACSKCGGVTEGRWKPGISYESQFQIHIEEPRQGIYGTCPLCREGGIYMPQGRVKSFHREASHIFLGQKYKEQGMVFRYIEVEKEWHLEQTCTEKGLEMCGAYEELTGIEIARAYFEPGEKLQMDFHKNNPYSGRDFWDDCNLSGLNSIRVDAAEIMPETYGNMKGTFLQYSAMEEYQKAAGEHINPVDYIERYVKMPQIEMLVKMGLKGVVEELVKHCHYGIIANQYAKKADSFLGIRKERVRQLISRQGDPDILKIMKVEKQSGHRWTDEQIEQMAELGLYNEISLPLEYMGIQRLLNRVEKYAGCGYGTMCSTASARLQKTAQTYIDYLNMRKSLGYDLNNTVYLFPRDLEAAHDKMVMEQNRGEAEKRIQEVNQKYQLIKKQYRKLRGKFYFEDEEFIIRPARDAGEIVMEGRILHHCVGGDNYLKKHNEGKSTILLLRFKSKPESPYITVEIGNDYLNIVQWYGAHDRKPDEDRMKRWLEAYVTRLKCTRDGTMGEAAVQVEEALMLPAM